MTYERSWSNWWRNFLGCSPHGYRAVVKTLQDRYIDEIRHVKRYIQHAARMLPSARIGLSGCVWFYCGMNHWDAERIGLTSAGTSLLLFGAVR